MPACSPLVTQQCWWQRLTPLEKEGGLAVSSSENYRQALRFGRVFEQEMAPSQWAGLPWGFRRLPQQDPVKLVLRPILEIPVPSECQSVGSQWAARSLTQPFVLLVPPLPVQ